jgi:hypothetical protein
VTKDTKVWGIIAVVLAIGLFTVAKIEALKAEDFLRKA